MNHTASANSFATSLINSAAAPMGRLAQSCGQSLPLQVLKSGAGFYLGTYLNGPYTRESIETWRTDAKAQQALADGRWTQKPSL